MIYAGIDPSWTGLAMVAIDDSGALVSRRTVETVKKAFPSQQARLWHLTEAVHEWLLDLEKHDQPIRCAVEGYSMGSKNGREMAGELGGQVRLALWLRGIPFRDVPPTTLKAFVTGKGNADKEVMLREVYKRWGYDADDNNDCDAYALARYEMAAAEPTAGFAKLLAKTPATEPQKGAFTFLTRIT